MDNTKNTNFSNELINFYINSGALNDDKLFHIFYIIMWSISYNYSDTFVSRIFNCGKCPSYYIRKKILENHISPNCIECNFYLTRKDITFLFFSIIDFKINISKKIMYKIASIIFDEDSKKYFVGLCKAYFKILHEGNLNDVILFPRGKRYSYFFDKIPESVFFGNYKGGRYKKNNLNYTFKGIIYTPMGKMNKKY